MTWDPAQYTRYAGERARPFLDLLSRVPASIGDVSGQRPAIADLGCGTGEMTRLIAERWPDAELYAVDNSSEMLEKAKSQPFVIVQADAADWTPPRLLDLLFSNATLHWVPDHERLIPRLASFVAAGGALAVQMPGNHDAPSHRAIRDVAARERWRDRLAGLADKSAHVRPLPWYVATLQRLGFEVEAWETTYLHQLSGEDAVLEWVKGTALRPFLDQLGDPSADAAAFLSELRVELRRAYPAEAGRVLFPFRRVFFVGVRDAASLRPA